MTAINHTTDYDGNARTPAKQFDGLHVDVDTVVRVGTPAD